MKSVRKTVRARKGSNKESAAIAICTKSVLQKRGRTMKRYSKKRLLTQKKFRGGILGAPKSSMSGLFSGKADPLYAPGNTFTPGTVANANKAAAAAAAAQKLKQWEERYNAEKARISKELEGEGIGSWEGEFRREVDANMSKWVSNNPKPS